MWRERSEPQARPRLDLVALVHADLRAAGLPAVRITSLGRCTRCEREQFFSYRGGDARARLGLALGWRPEGGARAKG
ncbi:MAG: hypothetical protein KatS3mg102_0187 [Planctomycetota bacterium]|nr:MAG: hypothetical protein KatS3mg102_0187 [Planctomycetota bacterium]